MTKPNGLFEQGVQAPDSHEFPSMIQAIAVTEPIHTETISAPQTRLSRLPKGSSFLSSNGPLLALTGLFRLPLHLQIGAAFHGLRALLSAKFASALSATSDTLGFALTHNFFQSSLVRLSSASI